MLLHNVHEYAVYSRVEGGGREGVCTLRCAGLLLTTSEECLQVPIHLLWAIYSRLDRQANVVVCMCPTCGLS